MDDYLDALLAEYPDFLTIEEAAQVLRLTPITVRQKLQTGVIRGYQPGGGRWIVAKPDLIDSMRDSSSRLAERPGHEEDDTQSEDS